MENFQFGDGGKGGSASEGGGVSRGDVVSNDGGEKDGSEIKYPDEEINPEDIPF